MNYLCILFLIYGVLTSIWVFNKDRVYIFYYVSLFLYSFIPFAARLYNNSLITTMSHVRIENNGVLTQYVVYAILFFSFSLLFFTFIINRPIYKKNRFRIAIPDFKGGLFVYIIISILVLAYLTIQLVNKYSLLNYGNQSLVKGNIVWYLLLEYVSVFFVIDLFFFFDKRNIKINRWILLIIGCLQLLVLVVTSSKIGNRGILIPGLMGFLFIVIDRMDFTIKLQPKQLKKVGKIVVGGLLIIGFSQFIRTNRGYDTFTNTISLKALFSFFKLDTILFQDYTYPGNGLMFVMQNHLINPKFVAISNFCNTIFFLNYETVAGYISRIIAPNMWFGIGGYIGTESFMGVGWLGILVYPLLISVIWRMYYKSIMRTSNKRYRRFLGFLMVTFLCLNLVRGQSYLLIKASYMYFLPSILLFKLIHKTRSEETL